MALLTRKFPTILGLVVLVAGIGFGIWYVNSKSLDNSGESQPINVRITNVQDNKFTVSWTTEVATTGKVFYGKVGDKLTSEKVDDRDSFGNTNGSYLTHYVTVSDLQPETVYAFRIASGSDNNLYDNNGSPYSITTGPTIAEIPSAETIYGQVQQTSTLPATDAIAYLTVPGGAAASTLVKSSGTYTFTVSTLRASDLKSYVKYDHEATVFSITVEQGKQQASAEVSTANAAPVPLITMGETHDYRAKREQPAADTPTVAHVEPLSPSPDPIEVSSTTPGVFNIEPLAEVSGVGTVTIINPSEEGEVLSAVRPELRGKGPKGTVLSLVVTSTKKTYKDTVAIASDGTWAWAPTTDLANGDYSLSLAYIDTSGKEQSLKRGFEIDATLTMQPAFVSTPSASVKPSILPSPSVRAAMPATESGVPVTGVIENTLLTVGFAAVIMISGVLFLAL